MVSLLWVKQEFTSGKSDSKKVVNTLKMMNAPITIRKQSSTDLSFVHPRPLTSAIGPEKIINTLVKQVWNLYTLYATKQNISTMYSVIQTDWR